MTASGHRWSRCSWPWPLCVCCRGVGTLRASHGPTGCSGAGS
jgi:hypothetical protein